MARLIIVLFALAVLAVSASANPEDYPGYVILDSVRAEPGSSTVINAWLRDNNAAISAITVPLQYSGQYLTLDSVVFDTIAWGDDFIGYSSIDKSVKTAQVSILPANVDYPLPTTAATDIRIAQLFFTIGSAAPESRVYVDSVYSDSVVTGDIHVYTRVEAADNTGAGIYLPDYRPGVIDIRMTTSIDEQWTDALPESFELHQNYPNPFNPSTVISFALPKASHVELAIFNVLGQEIARPAEGHYSAGVHEVTFDGENRSSGIYFYRLSWDGGTETRKMLLLK
jgi:hypothetical protein